MIQKHPCLFVSNEALAEVFMFRIMLNLLPLIKRYVINNIRKGAVRSPF